MNFTRIIQATMSLRVVLNAAVRISCVIQSPHEATIQSLITPVIHFSFFIVILCVAGALPFPIRPPRPGA
jgi:hypothetical protein